MTSTYLIAALLMAVAIGTYWWQMSALRAQQADRPAPFEADFYKRRHRRRTQISALLAAVAVAMLIGLYIADPLVLALYWFGVLILLLWIVLLAMLDASASHAFFSRVRSRELAEQAALHAEVRQQRGNQA